MSFVETDAGLMVPPSRNGHALSEANRQLAIMAELYEATISDLRIQIAEQGFVRLDGEGDQQFSRSDLGKIVGWSRAAYLKNPLIKRAVEVGALYVWGQSLSVKASDAVKPVIDRFDRDNAKTVSGQRASRLLDVELRVTGNVFLACFVDRVAGGVRVRQVPMEEMADIVCNPEDRTEVWFYKRTWSQRKVGGGIDDQMVAYYPDIDYSPASKPLTVQVDGREVEIRWDSPVVHVKSGAFLHWRWGVSEVYAALDWARAYKEQLEDDATRSKALARFAWRLTTDGGKAAVAGAKARLGTTITGSNGETNPPSAAASTFIGDKSIGLDPIKIAGSTLDPEHSRPARLMVAAAVGLPDTILSGDVDQGTLATAKSLDRPTELSYAEDRELWKEVRERLYRFAIDADLSALGGLTKGGVTEEDRTVELSFPDLLEPDVVARVQSVQTAAPFLPDELAARLMMAALGVEDIAGELAKLAGEKDANAKKAAAIAQKAPPVPPVDPNAPPVNPTEAKRPKQTEAEINAALAWFEGKAPKGLAGLLDAGVSDA